MIALGIGARKHHEVLHLQRHGLALQAAGLGLWEWQVETGAFHADMYWAMTLGYAVAELQPHIDAVRRLDHPDDTAGNRPRIEACLRGEAAEYAGETRRRHRDGHWVWLLELGMVI